MTPSTNGFTALVKQDGDWWIGWVAEAAGVSAQARTREDVLSNLQSALVEELQMRCEDVIAAADGFSAVDTAP